MYEIPFERIKAQRPSCIGLSDCRRSAVTIPLIKTADGYDILFEVRAENIRRQPGDICFPGGMVEPGESEQEGALRELREELLLSAQQIGSAMQLDYLWAHQLLIASFAVVLDGYAGGFNRDEVSEVFRVPLEFFLSQKPERHQIRLEPKPGPDFPYERIAGGRNYKWRTRQEDVLFYQYGDKTIWGITAKILDAFVKKVAAGDL